MATTATASEGKKETYSGGKKARPWDMRFWSGMNLTAWSRVLRKNHYRVSPSRWGMALNHTFLAGMNSSLALVQRLLYGRAIEKTQLCGDPIFIIGHWRSGTTLLHELMVTDPRHTFPTTYACFSPNNYLLTRRILPPILSLFMPDQRPMDNMPVGLDRPQEDEFALCAMGQPSPYWTMAFPNEPPQDIDYLNLDGIAPDALERWKRAFLWFLKCVTYVDPKRIVLKSPPHTGRVRVLLEMFPQAKFVHIVRDPCVLFASTVNLWKRLHEDQGFQVPKWENMDEYVFRMLIRMYDAFERDRHLIPAGQFTEVRYEDLTADPLARLERIYDDLQLGGFCEARPHFAKFLESQSGYKKNRYAMPSEMQARIVERWGAYFENYGYATQVE